MKKSKLDNNPVDSPAHYTSHPSGIEAIEICGYMGFNTGNSFKYLFRFENKWSPLEDLKKSRWYVDRELFQRGFSPISDSTLNFSLYWETDSRLLKKPCSPKHLAKVVGAKPGNIEKAMFYVVLADLHYEDSQWIHLQLARTYLNKEIAKRTKLANQPKK